jgi:cellobiose phosphorylase
MIETRYPGAHYRFFVHSPHTTIKTGGEELLTKDSGVSGTSLFVIAVQNSDNFCISITGGVVCPVQYGKIEDSDRQFNTDCIDASTFWGQLSLNLTIHSDQPDMAAIREILPWFGMNALTHYLTPYGLEQFSGAAWGTRDISQGPVDLLLSTEKYEAAKQILRIIFSNQHSDGSWPQWWMFDRYSEIRADSAHGDVIYWCILALSNYLMITGDYAFMNESLPFYHENPQKPEETIPLREHVQRVIDLITNSFMPGTALVPFGGGDWNDSLQPVSKDLARRMISSWTVEMNYQAFVQYGKVCRIMGDDSTAACLEENGRRIRRDFNKYLVKDGLVAGYGMVEADGNISLLLHPSDQTTGIRYSLLPMNRGIISGLFTKDQALRHLEVVEKHLKGPDGARLMDRPLRYHGGIQQIFQRAESSTFFGREIGLMYVHEHIRYAEVQAIMGHAEDFVKALRQANPVAYQEIVTCGDYRQSNCYYSSSDVTFKNRFEADEKYEKILTGNLLLKGGWRVYSSGPGIYIGLILNRLLGLRRKEGWLILDPVLPFTMDGLTVSIKLLGRKVTLTYLIRERNFSPLKITINGESIVFSLEENLYRKGGALIPRDHFLSLTTKEENKIEIML